jgi:hypothetical protein
VIYGSALPLLNAGRVELLDHRRVLAQLSGLERRTTRGGRDSIAEPPGSFDDCANACCGALVLAAQHAGRPSQVLALGLADHEYTPIDWTH